jgi:hypothetical protein
MAKWAGWGAGAAGAGAAGGPSRLFLIVALVFATVAAVLLARDGRWAAAGVAACAAAYFALRTFAGLGKRDE